MLLICVVNNKNRFETTSKVYFKEWSKDHQQHAPVGPGHYETLYLPSSEQVLQKKTPIKVGFTRMDRGLLNFIPS